MNSISTSAPASSVVPVLRLTDSRPGWLLECLACFVLGFAWFGATAWLRPLAIPDEGRYVGVAWEMLRSGDWWVPTLDGLPFFHKPPLFYWITAASMQVFGPSVAAARLVSVLAAAIAATGLFAFVRRWDGASRAWASVLVLATLPLYYGGAQYANLDMLVAACISIAVLLTAHAALSREGALPHRRALAFAFVAVGCGVLAKGLIGAVVPAIVVLAWGLATRRLAKVFALLLWAPGWLLCLAVAAPWFVAMQKRFPDFDHYFFIVQHLQRFTSSGFNSVQPFWFYPLALLTLALPWSPWLLVRLLRGPGKRHQPSDVRTLMLVWLAVVTVFFSIPSSKLIGYILPALPPLAFLVADAVRFAGQRAAASGRLARHGVAIERLHGMTLLLAATVCVSMSVAAHYFQPKSLQTLAAQMRAFRGHGEPVIFIGDYHYDVAFYAGLEAPASVVDDWSGPAVAKDSWRRELTDALHFAPAGSQRLLLPTAELDALLCRTPSSWVIGPWPAAAPTGPLATLRPVYRSGDVALWHVMRPAAGTVSAWRCDAAAVPAQ